MHVDGQETVLKQGVAADCALDQDCERLFGYALTVSCMQHEADGAEVRGLDACNGHIGATPTGRNIYYQCSV